MRLLFVFRDPGRMRYFESSLELLAERHDLRILIEEAGERIPGQLRFVEDLAAAHANIRVITLPRGRTTVWSPLERMLRVGLDFLHYRQRAFDAAPTFRRRRPRSRRRRSSGSRACAGACGHCARCSRRSSAPCR